MSFFLGTSRTCSETERPSTGDVVLDLSVSISNLYHHKENSKDQV